MSFLLVAVALFAYSCSKNEVENEERAVSNTKEFQEYIQAFDEYTNKTFVAIESLNDEEKEEFFNNVHNDEYMLSFLEEHKLVENNVILQEKVLGLKNNTPFMELDAAEQVNLFELILPLHQRLTETDLRQYTSSCREEMLRRIGVAQGIAYLEMIVCACMIEFPPGACACYAAIVIQYLNVVYEAERDYQECISPT